MSDAEQCFLNRIKSFWDKPRVAILPSQCLVALNECGIDTDGLNGILAALEQRGFIEWHQGKTIYITEAGWNA